MRRLGFPELEHKKASPSRRRIGHEKRRRVITGMCADEDLAKAGIRPASPEATGGPT